MASRADNIASNLSLANFSKASELKQRIWFTIGALIVFRFLSFVPLPGVNPLILQTLYDQTRGGTKLRKRNTISAPIVNQIRCLSSLAFEKLARLRLLAMLSARDAI